MMQRLYIDTTSNLCSVCLTHGDDIIDFRHVDLGRGHAERLIPLIAELPGGGACDGIYVSRGPGSFTGVRIGIAAARALALAWGVPIYGYGALQALSSAMRASQTHVAQSLHGVIIPGGHGEYFAQTFDQKGQATMPAGSFAPPNAVSVLQTHMMIGQSAAEFVALRGFGIAMDIRADARNAMTLSDVDFTSDIQADYTRAADAQMSIAKSMAE